MEDRNWMIKKSLLSGRGTFATKPIKRSTLIFSNKPVVTGPRGDCAGKIHCFICYQISEDCYSCEKCAFLVCSESCANSQNHIKECDFIVNNWKPKSDREKKPKILADILIYLRSFLLNEEQMQLLSLLQKTDVFSSFKELEVLCNEYTVPKGHIKFMRLIDSIVRVNAFRITSDDCGNKISLRGVYPLSSFVNHSCIPNTRIIFEKDHSMVLYASKDIETGEEIFTCYTGLLWCTPARRSQLNKTKGFWCKCERCNDATELGTNLSAIKCLNRECVGVILPLKPTDPNTHWQCDNCNNLVTPNQVSVVQSALGSLVGALDLDRKFNLDSLLLERLSNFIPYSNHIFVDLRLRLVLKIGFTDRMKLNELSESRLALKESLCRGTLRTVAALGAGDAHLRGLLLYHLHAALAERARRSPDLYEELKSEIESTIEQAYNILQGDISAPPDLQLRHRYLGPGCDKPHEERFFILSS